MLLWVGRVAPEGLLCVLVVLVVDSVEGLVLYMYRLHSSYCINHFVEL